MAFQLPSPKRPNVQLGKLRPATEHLQFFRLFEPAQYVTLYLNPRRLQIQTQKVVNKVMTTSGFVFQFWGNDVYTLSGDGITGYLHPEVFFQEEYQLQLNSGTIEREQEPSKLHRTPYDTPAYEALDELRQFYEDPNLTRASIDTVSTSELADKIDLLRIGLYYRRDLYVGHFTQYSFEETEESPWQWSYSFQFVADFRQARGRGSWGELELLESLQLQEGELGSRDFNFAAGLSQVHEVNERKLYSVTQVSGRSVYIAGDYGSLGNSVRLELTDTGTVVYGVIVNRTTSPGEASADLLMEGYSMYTQIRCETTIPSDLVAGKSVRIHVEDATLPGATEVSFA